MLIEIEDYYYLLIRILFVIKISLWRTIIFTIIKQSLTADMSKRYSTRHVNCNKTSKIRLNICKTVLLIGLKTNLNENEASNVEIASDSPLHSAN